MLDYISLSKLPDPTGLLGTFVLAVAVALAGCAVEESAELGTAATRTELVQPTVAIEAVETAPAVPPAATVEADPPDAKVIAVDLTASGTGDDFDVELSNVRILPGVAPNTVGNPPLLDIELRDSEGESLSRFFAWDPRWTFVWDADHRGEELVVRQEATVPVLFPFRPDLAEMLVFTEQQGRRHLASIDLAPTILDFCAVNPGDPDCAAVRVP